MECTAQFCSDVDAPLTMAGRGRRWETHSDENGRGDGAGGTCMELHEAAAGLMAARCCWPWAARPVCLVTGTALQLPKARPEAVCERETATQAGRRSESVPMQGAPAVSERRSAVGSARLHGLRTRQEQVGEKAPTSPLIHHTSPTTTRAHAMPAPTRRHIIRASRAGDIRTAEPTSGTEHRGGDRGLLHCHLDVASHPWATTLPWER